MSMVRLDCGVFPLEVPLTFNSLALNQAMKEPLKARIS